MSNYNSTAITPKISEKSGFTHFPHIDAGIIAGQVKAFLARGGEIEIVKGFPDSCAKARMGYGSHSGYAEA